MKLSQSVYGLGLHLLEDSDPHTSCLSFLTGICSSHLPFSSDSTSHFCKSLLSAHLVASTAFDGCQGCTSFTQKKSLLPRSTGPTGKQKQRHYSGTKSSRKVLENAMGTQEENEGVKSEISVVRYTVLEA